MPLFVGLEVEALGRGRDEALPPNAWVNLNQIVEDLIPALRLQDWSLSCVILLRKYSVLTTQLTTEGFLS